MHSPSKFTIAIASGLLLALQAAAITANTPTALTTCQPVRLSWTDGTAPFYPVILPGGQPSATPLVQFPQTSDTSLTWNVNLAAGTSVTFSVSDSTGDISYSAQVTVSAGQDTSCVGQSAAGGASTTGTRRLQSTGRTQSTAANTANSPTSSADGTFNFSMNSDSPNSASVDGSNKAADSSSGASRIVASLSALTAGGLVILALF